MKDVLCNAAYPLKQRVSLFDSTITSAVLYGAGSWTMTQELDSKLRKAQRQMLRSIFQKGRRRMPQVMGDGDGHSSTESSESENVDVACDAPGEELEPWHEWIKRTTHEIEGDLSRWRVEDWVTAQRRRYYRWAGHIAHRNDNRWSALVLDWATEAGTCGAGRVQARPRKRWDDLLENYFKELGHRGWRFIAANRDEWMRYETMFVQSWMHVLAPRTVAWRAQ